VTCTLGSALIDACRFDSSGTRRSSAAAVTATEDLWKRRRSRNEARQPRNTQRVLEKHFVADPFDRFEIVIALTQLT
jgi:hypothetical protein